LFYLIAGAIIVQDMMPNKKNVFILNSALLSTRDAALWNSLYTAHKSDFEFLFFTAMATPGLKLPNVIPLSYGKNIFFEAYNDEVSLHKDQVELIAGHDKIWEHYDPINSKRVAYSWLLYWISALKICSPSAVYIWNGFHAPEVALAMAADTLGIRRYFVERGPFAGTYAFDERGINYRSSFVPHFEEFGMEVRPEGVARFAEQYYTGGISNWGQPDRITSRNDFLNKFAIPDGKTVLFFPSQVNKDSNSKIFSPHYVSVFDAYKHLTDSLAPYSKDVFLLAKKHPMQEGSSSFERLPLTSGIWVEEAHIFDCIEYSDAIVSINSSSAVEASLLGKPVLTLGQSILDKNQSVLGISEKSELKTRLDDLLTLVKNGKNQVDNLFFSKLLFGYLFSPDSEFNRIGVQGVHQIPFPKYPADENNNVFPAEELANIAKVLAIRPPAQIHKNEITLKEWLVFAKKIPIKILNRFLS
jgi:hypothetical protein